MFYLYSLCNCLNSSLLNGKLAKCWMALIRLVYFTHPLNYLQEVKIYKFPLSLLISCLFFDCPIIVDPFNAGISQSQGQDFFLHDSLSLLSSQLILEFLMPPFCYPFLTTISILPLTVALPQPQGTSVSLYNSLFHVSTLIPVDTSILHAQVWVLHIPP